MVALQSRLWYLGRHKQFGGWRPNGVQSLVESNKHRHRASADKSTTVVVSDDIPSLMGASVKWIVNISVDTSSQFGGW